MQPWQNVAAKSETCVKREKGNTLRVSGSVLITKTEESFKGYIVLLQFLFFENSFKSRFQIWKLFQNLCIAHRASSTCKTLKTLSQNFQKPHQDLEKGKTFRPVWVEKDKKINSHFLLSHLHASFLKLDLCLKKNGEIIMLLKLEY